jgi:hypothetical protein
MVGTQRRLLLQLLRMAMLLLLLLLLLLVDAVSRVIAARSRCSLAGAGRCTSSSSLCRICHRTLLLRRHASCIQTSCRLSRKSQHCACDSSSLSCRLWSI